MVGSVSGGETLGHPPSGSLIAVRSPPLRDAPLATADKEHSYPTQRQQARCWGRGPYSLLLQPVSLSYLPTLGGSGQSAAPGTCGPILAGGGVKAGPDSTKSNLLGKFAFDSLLTGCAALCSREMGALVMQ